MRIKAPDDHFFTQLPAIPGFGCIDRMDRFYPAPDGWWIVIADVVNSTRAVSQGRYKQVNMIGASCITAVLNALDGIDVPFVFGGDGATLLVPERMNNTTAKALSGVRAMAGNEFGIELRYGLVPVEELRTRDRDVRVARLELSPGNNLALFSGGGIELADRLVKTDTKYSGYSDAQDTDPTEPDLSGLSCRWQPLKSQNGSILCILIRALSNDTQRRHFLFSEILEQLSRILGQDFRQSSPVSARNMRFRWPPAGLGMEARLTRGKRLLWYHYAYLLYQSFIQFILERFDLGAGGYNAPVYRREVRENADYRRFDDSVRLVLDCTPAQVNAVTTMLEQYHHSGDIVYGLHKTPEAQMTCLVFSLENSEHLHFVDGANGGFWAAAVQLKKQLADRVAYENNT